MRFTAKYASNQKATALLVAFFISMTVSLAAHAAEDADSEDDVVTVYFALGDAQQRPLTQPQQRFNCTDKIFTVIELRHHTHGRYQLEVRWIDPHQTTRETTRYPFVVSQPETRLWAWLSLSRGAGAGMLQWINPAAGLEEFIGPWIVEVRVDGKKIEVGEFEVNC